MLTEKQFSEAVQALGGSLYIAGGWVRDRLLGRCPGDRDYVVCGLTAEKLCEAFQCSRVGRQFPVFLVEVDGTPREVALARKERKTGRGYHGFETCFTPETTIEEDLYRRDTTMNSMALRLSDGKIIDPFGGQRDLRASVIRATSFHFRDDPVRALRAARQSAQLGFSIEPGTRALMRDCHDELMAEPGERIFGEMKKALESPAPAAFFLALRDAELLDAVFPELNALRGVPQPVLYHRGLDAFDHTMEVLKRTAASSTRPETRFAAVAHDLGKGLTPKEILPHHYGHQEAGLEALKSLNRRMTLPRAWYRMAHFIISQHMALRNIRRAGAILEMMERIERLSLNPSEILAVLRADHGGAPNFLLRYDLYRSWLSEARKKFPVPQAIPPDRRRLWLHSRLSGEMAAKIRLDELTRKELQDGRIEK
ncbi:MAG: HD domain-containing protein [Pyramidobacter sp.]|jgi:tRNA nucleotidyltransferase (CCA-adding enzyme)